MLNKTSKRYKIRIFFVLYLFFLPPFTKICQYISVRYLKKEFRSKLKKKKILEYKNDYGFDLEKVIDDYSGYIYKVIQSISFFSFSNEDIEEMISDVFVVIWKNQEILEDDKMLSSYIAGVTKNIVYEKLRKQKSNLDIADFENILKEISDIDLLCEEREKIEIIQNALDKMNKEDSQIFKLFYYEAQSIDEISKKLEISNFGVKSRLYRIRKKLKSALLKGGYGNE